MRLSYTSDRGQTGTANTHFVCGPDRPTAVTPVITQIALPAPNGSLRVGDTVTVCYSEKTSTGVWLTDVQLSGAFAAEQAVGEHLLPNFDRTVKFVVPASAYRALR